MPLSKALVLIVQQKAQDDFEKTFGLPGKNALEQRRVYNLVDGTVKLGFSMSESGAEYVKLKVRGHAQVWWRFKWRTGELKARAAWVKVLVSRVWC